MSDTPLLDAVRAWAERRDDVRAVILVGSRARAGTPADEWSDTDLVLFVEDPLVYVTDADWLKEFGRPLLTFMEPTAVGGAVERRVLYDTGADADFALVATVLASETLDAEGGQDVRAVFERGYRVLVDKDRFASLLPPVTGVPERLERPSQEELDDLTHDFWYHALWAARKLRRGELWTAKEGWDALLHRLLTLLRWHSLAADPARDTWHGGRFLEQWADPRALAALREITVGFQPAALEEALRQVMDLFEWVQLECAGRLGLNARVPVEEVRRLVDGVLLRPLREEPEQKPEEEE